MSLVKSVSEIKKITAPIENVYNFLSDFERIAALFQNASGQIPEEEKAKIADKIDNFSATKDSCAFSIKGFGDTGLTIVEKEEYKTIKYQADGSSPVPITLWIQLVSVSEYDTRMRLTLHAELNMMMKMMLKGKLEKGVNQIADALARIPY